MTPVELTDKIYWCDYFLKDVKCTRPVPVVLGDDMGFVPCGKCANCISAKSREWSLRLQMEYESYEQHVFLTLTYDDDHVPLDGKVSKRDCQLFFKRLRKTNPSVQFCYFLAGEYGEKGSRPHYHVILFCKCDDGVFNLDVIERVWSNGSVRCDYVTSGSILYVVNYTRKDLRSGKKGFHLVSKGLGKGLVIDRDFILRHGCIEFRGQRYSVPRYIVDRLCFDSDEKIAFNIQASKYIPPQNYEESAIFNQRTKNLLAKRELFRKEKL